MRRKIVPNDILLAEVAKIIAGGEKVVLLTKGQSMLPFIVGGRDSVELSPIDTPILPNDILLAKIENPSRYVIHRVIGVDGGVVTLMGDGNIKGVEICYNDTAVARVTAIIKPKKTINPYSRREVFFLSLWRFFKPFRRYLLKLIRVVYLNH